MLLAFTRHGHANRTGKTDLGLTPRGLAAAQRAGDWLLDQGLTPDGLVHTRTPRARQTADQIAAALPALNATVRWQRAGMPNSLKGFAKLLDEIAARVGPANTVFLVGHHSTQQFIESKLGGARFAVPAENRGATFVLQPDAEGLWTCIDAWPGLAP